MKWLVGEDLCIGGKLCGGFVNAHITCYWALIQESAITLLSFLERTAANLVLLGLTPLSQHRLNCGANSVVEENVHSPISCHVYCKALFFCEMVL